MVKLGGYVSFNIILSAAYVLLNYIVCPAACILLVITLWKLWTKFSTSVSYGRAEQCSMTRIRFGCCVENVYSSLNTDFHFDFFMSSRLFIYLFIYLLWNSFILFLGVRLFHVDGKGDVSTWISPCALNIFQILKENLGISYLNTCIL